MTMSLSAEHYTSAEVFATERQRIARRAWWLVGPQQQVKNPGQYIADEICGLPVFVIRSAQGTLRAFHNVCRHRAAPLLEPGQGRCESLRCPYHGWLYSLDGQLQKAPRFGDNEDFRAKELSLYPIRVESWRGLVFVAFADDIGGLRQWLGSGVALCEPYPLPDELEYFGEYTVTGNANWKAYCDNTVEGYHLNSIHPRLSQSLRGGNVEIKPYDDGQLVAFHVTHPVGTDGASLRGNDGLWFYRFPGFQIVAGRTAFKAERVEGLAAGQLRSRNWAWYRDLSGAERESAFNWSKQIVLEDLGICERVQRNLEAGIYQRGPLSPTQESNTARFQAIVLEAISSGN